VIERRVRPYGILTAIIGVLPFLRVPMLLVGCSDVPDATQSFASLSAGKVDVTFRCRIDEICSVATLAVTNAGAPAERGSGLRDWLT
jgi:hypothetical protein